MDDNEEELETILSHTINYPQYAQFGSKLYYVNTDGKAHLINKNEPPEEKS